VSTRVLVDGLSFTVQAGNVVVLWDDQMQTCPAIVLGVNPIGTDREPILDLLTCCLDMDRAGAGRAATLELAGVLYGPGEPGHWSYPPGDQRAPEWSLALLPVGPAADPTSARITLCTPVGANARCGR